MEKGLVNKKKRGFTEKTARLRGAAAGAPIGAVGGVKIVQKAGKEKGIFGTGSFFRKNF